MLFWDIFHPPPPCRHAFLCILQHCLSCGPEPPFPPSGMTSFMDGPRGKTSHAPPSRFVAPPPLPVISDQSLKRIFIRMFSIFLFIYLSIYIYGFLVHLHTVLI